MLSRLRWLIISFLLGCGGGPASPPPAVATRCPRALRDTVHSWIDSTRYEILIVCRRPQP